MNRQTTASASDVIGDLVMLEAAIFDSSIRLNGDRWSTFGEMQHADSESLAIVVALVKQEKHSAGAECSYLVTPDHIGWCWTARASGGWVNRSTETLESARYDSYHAWRSGQCP